MAELARGTVGDRPWGQTFGRLGSRGLSGQLDLTSDGKVYSVAFARGAIVGAVSPLANDALVRIALTSHLVTSTQVADIARHTAAAPHRDEAEIIAEIARLAPDQIQRLRRRAVAQRAARTFSLGHGDFVVVDRVSIPVVPGSEVDVRAVMYLGARGNLSEARLEEEVYQLGVWFKLKPEAVADLAQYGFTETEKRVLTKLVDGATLADLALEDPQLDNRGVRAIVYSLAAYGACDTTTPPGLVVQSRTPTKPSVPSADMRGRMPSDAPTMRPKTQPPVSRTQSIEAPVARATTSPPIATPRTQTPTAIPRTQTPTATPRTQAPVSRATSSPPIAAPRTQAPTATPRTQASTAAPRAQTAPTEARTPTPPTMPRTQTPVATARPAQTGRVPTSSSQPPAAPPSIARTKSPDSAGPNVSRTKSPDSAAPKVSRTKSPDSSGPTASRTKTPEAAPAVSRTKSSGPHRVRRMSAPNAETEKLIAALTPLVDRGADHFELLGVTFDAPTEQVRNAYFGLARKLHPDKLSSLGIADAQRQAQRLFAQINTAFATLTDPQRRRDYLDMHRRGGEAVVKAEDGKADELATKVMRAEEAFKQGEMAMRREQFDQAIAHFQTACELQPNEPEYVALLAWARFAAAPDKNVVAAATRAALQRAVDDAVESVTPRFYLGRVERMLGREKEALSHFQEVLRTKPHHAEAASEARILEQRLKNRR